MRNGMLAAIVALGTFASFPAPLLAGTDDGPECFVKTLLSYDHYGNPVVERVRVCR